MSKRTWSDVLAGGCGGGIGALLCFQFSPFLAWIGGLVGFLIGYLGGDLREIRLALPRAYLSAKKTFLQVGGWRPKEGFLTQLKLLGYAAVVVFTTVSLLVFFSDSLTGRGLSRPGGNLLFNFCLGLIVTFGFSLLAFESTTVRNKEVDKEMLEDVKLLATWWNPITCWVTIFWFFTWVTPRFLWKQRVTIKNWLQNQARAGGKFLQHFTVELLLLIHSHRRLVRGLAGLVGAGLGYATGQVWTGCLVGFLSGSLLMAGLTALSANQAIRRQANLPWS